MESRTIVRPGFVAGASASDPTTVASLAVVGATTMYGLAWLVIAVLPMLAVVQVIAGSIGAATRTSLQGAIVRQYGMACGLVSLIAIVAINLFTLIADVEAGAQALSLLSGVPYQIFVFPFVAAVGFLLLAHSYSRVAAFLMVLPVLFVAYGLSAVLAHPHWGDVLRDTFIPHIEFSAVFMGGALALLGTTLTSYEYLWESIEISESPQSATLPGPLKRGAVLGVLASGAGFWFILVASGATLGIHHHPIETAANAAAALRPVAGPWAEALFGIGLLGSAALAVPVLAACSAYAIGQTFRWKGTLDSSFNSARPFYIVIIVALLIAAGASFTGSSPIWLLYWASIAGGFATPVTLILMNCIARNRTVMGAHQISVPLSIAGWAVTSIVTLACGSFLFSLLRA